MHTSEESSLVHEYSQNAQTALMTQKLQDNIIGGQFLTSGGIDFLLGYSSDGKIKIIISFLIEDLILC
jgi:hypothetical protein